MARNHDPRLDLSAVRARYNDPTRYTAIDSWHRFTATEIDREIAEAWHSLSTQSSAVVLNAGSGGNDHFSNSARIDPQPSATINVDISEKLISGLPYPVAASIEALPLLARAVDIVVCVGSVINYCDAAAAIAEFGRIIRPAGHLILEFESSLSAELITQDAFSKSAAIAETFYGNQAEAVWVYRPAYIRNLLQAAGFQLVRSVPIHVLSPWLLLFFRSVRIAAAIARLDQMARKVPGLTHWASNHLFFCEKSA